MVRVVSYRVISVQLFHRPGETGGATVLRASSTPFGLGLSGSIMISGLQVRCIASSISHFIPGPLAKDYEPFHPAKQIPSQFGESMCTGSRNNGCNNNRYPCQGQARRRVGLRDMCCESRML